MDLEDLEVSTPFFNESVDDSYEVHRRQSRFYSRLFIELFSLVGLLSIIANVLMAFVIIKHKKLRNVVTNQILLQINILQTVYMFATPLTFRIITEVYDMEVEVNRSFILTVCVMNEIESVILFATILLLVLLLCDWYIKVYHGNKYKKFGNVYKFFIVLNYVFILCAAPISSRFCYPSRSYVHFGFTIFLDVLAHLVMIFTLIILNIVHKFKSRRLLNNVNNTGLMVANIVLFLWCPIILLTLLAIGGWHSAVATIIFSTFGFSSPVFILLYLFYTDDGFNVCLKKVLKCRCNEYKNETMDDDPISYNNVNGVRIS